MDRSILLPSIAGSCLAPCYGLGVKFAGLPNLIFHAVMKPVAIDNAN
jgi:hypothetical protein